MASDDELPNVADPDSYWRNLTASGFNQVKRRRPKRSCDICRQRKIRCDGHRSTQGSCSNCLAFGFACTYIKPAQKRGPKDVTMAELKRELASLKEKLRSLSLCPICAQSLQSLSPQEDGFARSTPEVGHGTPESHTSSKEPPDEKDFTADELAARFSQVSLEAARTRYMGSASTFALADNAIAMKEKYLGRSSPPSRRPLFWDVLPWEKEAYELRRPRYVFPPHDLIVSLLNLYFTNVHPTIPILHRPSFERSVARGLHLTDVEFGGTLLSVLAVASRYSNDPRVFVDGDTSLSGGFKYASQLQILRKSFNPSIYQVQMYCLLTLFALGASLPQSSWLYTGLGIRFLQQRGEHRRKPEGHEANAEDELWKRAFWSFIALERTVCLFLGRPMGLHTEEYDTELPLEVDDEYWDQGFTQPPGTPSQLSFFICHLRLGEILGDAMRRLYGTKKSKLMMGWDGPEWEQRAVAELDSSLNDFQDSIPPHLRWDPENPPQDTFFDQSATLHITYNYARIVIHRPYIQKVAAPAGPPSLSICAGAARSIIHTTDIWLHKLQRPPLPYLMNPVFVSGVILVLYMLSTKGAGPIDEKSKDLVLVATAVEVHKFAESRMQPVGSLTDLLRELWLLDRPLPLKNSLNTEDTSADAVASENAASESAPSTSSGILVPSLECVPEMYPHLPTGQPAEFWNTDEAPSNQPLELRPGMSIEQLLADTEPLGTIDSILNGELMAMWMAAPTDMAHVGEWDAYIENMNINVNWSNSFGAPER